MEAKKKRFYELFIDAYEKAESKNGGLFIDKMFEELQEAVNKDDLLHFVSGLLPDKFANCLPEGYEFVNEEPLINDVYDANGNTIDGKVGLLMIMRRQYKT